MNRNSALALVGLLLASPAAALGQSTPRLEIGTSAAMSIVSRHGWDNVFYIILPGQGYVSSPGIYFGFFPSSRVIVEPEVNFSYLDQGGSGVTNLGLTGRVKYLFRNAAVGSPYVSGQVGLMSQFAGYAGFGTETAYSIGGGVGYRVPIASSLALSVEGRYEHWTGKKMLGADMNEFEIVFSLAALIKR